MSQTAGEGQEVVLKKGISAPARLVLRPLSFIEANAAINPPARSDSR